MIKLEENQLDAEQYNQHIIVKDRTNDNVLQSEIVAVFDRGKQGFDQAHSFCREKDYSPAQYSVTTFGEELQRAARLQIDTMIPENLWD